jgi:primosomal protein N'
VPLASVYPLVTARALARPFTYEVDEGVEPGNVVEVRLSGARRRGVVVSLGDEAPPGVEPAPAGPVVDRLPRPLVELALWLAEYYGSTPARALQLVAPLRRARRGERSEPSVREALAGEAEPEQLSGAQRGALERIVALLEDGKG